MKTCILHTPEAQAEWDALVLEQDTHKAELRKIEGALTALAAKTFEHILRTGKWKVTNRNKIVPDDVAAEAQVQLLVRTALKLGYHESFHISDGTVEIYGWVDDGELSLEMYPIHMKDGIDPDMTRAAFNAMQVSIDLADWAANLRAQAISSAQREIASAQQRLDALLKAKPSSPLLDSETAQISTTR